MFFRRPLAGPCFECSVDRVVSRVPDPVRCAVGPPVGPDACRAGICRCATRPVASVISPARALRQVASTVRPGFEGVPGGLVFRLPYACALAGLVWSVDCGDADQRSRFTAGRHGTPSPNSSALT